MRIVIDMSSIRRTLLLPRPQDMYLTGRMILSRLFSRNSLNVVPLFTGILTIAPIGLLAIAGLFAVAVPIMTKSKGAKSGVDNAGDEKKTPTVNTPTINEPQKSGESEINHNNTQTNTTTNQLTNLDSKENKKGINK